MTRMAPLSEAAMALPPAVIRNDAGVVLTMTRFLRAVLKTIPVRACWVNQAADRPIIHSLTPFSIFHSTHPNTPSTRRAPRSSRPSLPSSPKWA
jgi:hypothetical protein